MISPINIMQPLLYKAFSVDLKFNDLVSLRMRKQADNLVKIEENFGSVVYDGLEYSVKNAYFRFPSEHKINGERMAMELQMIGESSAGSKVGMSVLFNVGENVNYFLNELDFGKGYLKELPISTQSNSKFYEVKSRLNFGTLFTNRGSWLMYEGSDTNVPCDKITWLLSYDVVDMHKEQLYDIPATASAFFSIKPLREDMNVYRNVRNEAELMDDMKASESKANSDMKALFEAQAKEREQQKTKGLAEAVENALQKDSAEIKAAKKEIEDAKIKAREEVLQKMREERFKKLKEKEIEVEREHEANKLYPTTLLYERIMNKIIDYSFIPPPCPDFAIYKPPSGKSWGYVPPKMIMTWEISDYVGKPKVEIANPDPPKPTETELVYRPFYYKAKPQCQTAPQYPDSIISTPANASGQIKLDPSSISSLAQLDMYILNQTKIVAVDNVTLIPVYVKTTPGYNVPTLPTTIFVMLNGTNLSKTSNLSDQKPADGNSANKTALTTSVSPVAILRDFNENVYQQKEIDAAKIKNTVVKPTHNGGYKAAPELGPSLPNILNVTYPEGDKLLRVWPQLESEFEEGTLPIDAKYAWMPMPEPDQVINLDPPKTVDPEYRWMLYFWAETPYTIGFEKKNAWIPFYILGKSDFQWVLSEVPPSIPVPKNLSRAANSSLPTEELLIKFSPLKTIDMVKDKNVFAIPSGVDSSRILEEPISFRTKLEKMLIIDNPLYMQAIEDKYRKTPGMLAELQRRRAEEVTGILVQEDITWRVDRDRREIERLNPVKKMKDTLDDMINSRSMVGYKRVCQEYGLEAVLNHRSVSELHGIHPKSYFTCKKWGWEPINEEEIQKKVNTTTPAANESTPVNKKTSEHFDFGDSGPSKKDQDCHEYLKIILNRRRMFFSETRNDYMDKYCEELFTRMRQKRLEDFKGGLGPAFRNAKDISKKSSTMIKQSFNQIVDEIRKINPNFKLPTIKMPTLPDLEKLKNLKNVVINPIQGKEINKLGEINSKPENA